MQYEQALARSSTELYILENPHDPIIIYFPHILKISIERDQ